MIQVFYSLRMLRIGDAAKVLHCFCPFTRQQRLCVQIIRKHILVMFKKEIFSLFPEKLMILLSSPFPQCNASASASHQHQPTFQQHETQQQTQQQTPPPPPQQPSTTHNKCTATRTATTPATATTAATTTATPLLFASVPLCFPFMFLSFSFSHFRIPVFLLFTSSGFCPFLFPPLFCVSLLFPLWVSRLFVVPSLGFRPFVVPSSGFPSLCCSPLWISVSLIFSLFLSSLGFFCSTPLVSVSLFSHLPLGFCLFFFTSLGFCPFFLPLSFCLSFFTLRFLFPLFPLRFLFPFVFVYLFSSSVIVSLFFSTLRFIFYLLRFLFFPLVFLSELVRVVLNLCEFC